jgi:hypothetical protein
LRLGEEAVAADVEAVTAMLDGARDAADVVGVLLQDANGRAVLDELVCRGQASRTRAENDDRLIECLDRN